VNGSPPRLHVLAHAVLIDARENGSLEILIVPQIVAFNGLALPRVLET
jgi:hypothetical protein